MKWLLREEGLFIKGARTLFTLWRDLSGFLFLALLEFCMLVRKRKVNFSTQVFWLEVLLLLLEDWLPKMELLMYDTCFIHAYIHMDHYST